MTKLEKIEREIASLAPEELARFRDWFAEFDAERQRRIGSMQARVEEGLASGIGTRSMSDLLAEARYRRNTAG